jgi:hypothetical protein
MRQLLNWLRRGKLERGLDRELGYHLDHRVSDLVLAGLPEQEARRQAMLELGGLTQVREEVRDVWIARWLRDFAQDLRCSARSFLRSPSFTVTAVLSLALGIGATTAIYSLVDQVLLHALPVRQPDRLVLIDWKGDQAATGFGSYNLMSYPICRDLQLQDRFFDGVLCRAATTVNLSTGGEPKPAAAEIVSGSYFSVLGVGPAIGRLVERDDDGTPGASPVVVISYDFWKTQLVGDPEIVGRKVLVNQHPMTVIGVAAAGFRGIDVGEVPSLWIPAAMSAQAIPGFNGQLNRRTRWMQILGRLRPDVTAAQVQAGLQPWFKAMLDEDTRRAEFPRITAERRQRFLASTLVVTPAPQGHSFLRRRLSQPLWVLFAVTAVLLGLACLNVAGLLLARGSARERELSTRLALGASRGRIGRRVAGAGTGTGRHVGSDRIPASRRGGQRPAVHGGLAPAGVCVSGQCGRGHLERVCARPANGARLADHVAPGARRRLIWGRTASQGDCDGSDCVHVDPGDRCGVVRANFERTDGQRAGVRHIQPGFVRPRSGSKRLFPAGSEPTDSPRLC